MSGGSKHLKQVAAPFMFLSTVTDFKSIHIMSHVIEMALTLMSVFPKYAFQPIVHGGYHTSSFNACAWSICFSFFLFLSFYDGHWRDQRHSGATGDREDVQRKRWSPGLQGALIHSIWSQWRQHLFFSPSPHVVGRCWEWQTNLTNNNVGRKKGSLGMNICQANIAPNPV